MAVLWLESYDSTTTLSQLATNRGYTLANTGVNYPNALSAFRTGNGVVSANTNNHNWTLKKTFSSPNTNGHIFGTCYQTSINGAHSSSVALFKLYDGATVQVSLYINRQTGVLTFYRGDGSVSLGNSGGNVIAQGVNYYIEIECTVHNTTGSFTVTVNGVTFITGSGVNTRSSANNQWDAVQWGAHETSGGWEYFDDTYIADNSSGGARLGAVKIESRKPSGAGTTTQWAPSAGSNYDCVDETNADGDTSYVASATVGQIDTYAYQDLAALTGTVKAVQVYTSARKDDVDARAICPEYRSGGANYDGATINLSNSYALYSDVKETNPATSAAWTISEVNALEVGVKVVS